jgi:hypothetical protein
MGESGSSSSLALFKTRLGARPMPYAGYFIEKLPLSAADQRLRQLVKQAIGFKDAS